MKIKKLRHVMIVVALVLSYGCENKELAQEKLRVAELEVILIGKDTELAKKSEVYEKEIADLKFRVSLLDEEIKILKETDRGYFESGLELFKENIELRFFATADEYKKQKTSLAKSVELFERLIGKFPESTYKNKSAEYILKAKKSLDELNLVLSFLEYFENNDRDKAEEILSKLKLRISNSLYMSFSTIASTRSIKEIKELIANKKAQEALDKFTKIRNKIDENTIAELSKSIDDELNRKSNGCETYKVLRAKYGNLAHGNILFGFFKVTGILSGEYYSVTIEDSPNSVVLKDNASGHLKKGEVYFAYLEYQGKFNSMGLPVPLFSANIGEYGGIKNAYIDCAM